MTKTSKAKGIGRSHSSYIDRPLMNKLVTSIHLMKILRLQRQRPSFHSIPFDIGHEKERRLVSRSSSGSKKV